MSNEADLIGIDAAVAIQEVNGSDSVVGKIGGRGWLRMRCGSANAGVVNPEYGDASSCQMIGDHQEGFVAEYFAVAILRSAARYEQYRWKDDTQPLFATIWKKGWGPPCMTISVFSILSTSNCVWKKRVPDM